MLRVWPKKVKVILTTCDRHCRTWIICLYWKPLPSGWRTSFMALEGMLGAEKDPEPWLPVLS